VAPLIVLELDEGKEGTEGSTSVVLFLFILEGISPSEAGLFSEEFFIIISVDSSSDIKIDKN
jgi:hypothetical protein